MKSHPASLLEVENLRVGFPSGGGTQWAVDGATFHLRAGERIAIVGESGSGKSVCAQAISRIVEHRGGRIDPASRITFDGIDVLGLGAAELNGLRGSRVGYTFQEHQSALNPVRRIGNQIVETLLLHQTVGTRSEARRRAVELLREVGIQDPERVADAYPHELSGGLRQRATIAVALAPEPDVLIADEPSTALDILTQRQIVDLLLKLNISSNLAVVLISHDLDLVRGFAERLYVMYAGKFAETGRTADVLDYPQHHYTRALLASVPNAAQRRATPLRAISGSAPSILERPTGCPFHPRCTVSDGASCVTATPMLGPIADSGHEVACHHPGPGAGSPLVSLAERAIAVETPPTVGGQETLLTVDHLTHEFRGPRRLLSRTPPGVKAVDDVSFTVRRGEIFGLVGESGSGKSTVARCVANLIRPTGGQVVYGGEDLSAQSRKSMRLIRRRLQVVFQDPRASLDPLRRVESLLAEPLRIYGLWNTPGNDRVRLEEMVELVGLTAECLAKYPHELSGGQLQRVALARALMLRPDLLICDEVTTQLDASVAAQIINLLGKLHREFNLTYLIISHDLAFVRYFTDRVAVIRHGQVVECGDTADVFANPQHEYTQALVAAHPTEPTQSHSLDLTVRTLDAY